MENVAQPEDREQEYPESWIWDTDGNYVLGRYVRFSQGPTRDYGRRPILVLDVDGAQRSIWLNGVVLLNRIRDEVATRPSRDLTPGERVSIRRLEKTKGEGGRQGYWKFSVQFPDKPEPSAEEILFANDGLTPEGTGQPVLSSSQGDDIPF
jgi:hypothetical protein